MRRGRCVRVGVLAACGGGGGDDGEDTGPPPMTTSGPVTPTSGADSESGETGETTGEPPDAAQLAIQRYCEFLFTCGCQPVAHVDVDGCVGTLSYGLSSQKQLAAMAGQTFDPGCYARGFDYQVDVVGCKTADEIAALPPPPDCPRCTYAHGDLPADAACMPSMLFIFGTDCVAGLECVDGVCRDRCEILTTGEACATNEGDDLACEPGLFCAASGDGTCTPYPGSGEPCPQNLCADGLQCVGTCEPLPQSGEPCTGTCAAGLVCDPVDGCQPPPGPGEACIQGTCAVDLYCAAVTCEPRLPAGSPCEAEDACAFNSECVRGTCEPQLPRLCAMN